MKKDKLLVNIEIPDINKKYDLFISGNELTWKTIKLILKLVSKDTSINPKENYMLYNKNTNTVYNNNIFIKDTNIINGSELVLIRI